MFDTKVEWDSVIFSYLCNIFISSSDVAILGLPLMPLIVTSIGAVIHFNMFRRFVAQEARHIAQSNVSRGFRTLTQRFPLLATDYWQRPLHVSCLVSSARCSSTTPSDDEFEFDSAALVHREAVKASAASTAEQILAAWGLSEASDAAKQKVRASLRSHPVDNLIEAATVQVTHIENEAGKEEKTSLSPMSLKDAIDSAKERGMCVVQMAEKDGVAFVRIRNERKRILDSLGADLTESGGSTSQQQPSIKLKDNVDHIFRDVVDAHFIGWKSKKIVEDLKKLHPVKLGIQQFQTGESAMSKLREMCLAVQKHAEAVGVSHHYTSIHASDRDVSVVLTPTGVKGGAVKHPGEKEWSHAAHRLQDSLRKSGRLGTYAKADVLKPRSLGSVPYRVDKFGRRVG